MSEDKRFDEAYYRRFYDGPGRVHGESEIAMLATGVVCHLSWMGQPVRSVLDVGAGLGLWRDWFRQNRPDVAYTSTDVSPYACQEYGHELRDISKWRALDRFDLIICQGVLQYLDDAAAKRAIANIGAMAQGFLYLEAITRHDLESVVDRERTDTSVHARTGAWYRKLLKPHFRQMGAGLWVSRRGGLEFYELEWLGR